ncbi:MAG: type II toxin-antitoxin system RelE/ParE family toxin [Chloroflexi bacterium]|nr:type II toxin-antitoxin system RelE/ParE family toxin [Chloroflexota bacterium]
MPRQDRERVLRALQGLADDPLPGGVRKLQSRAPAWRLRVGQYRVIYAVFHHDQLILVAAIERRSERTYQDIDRLLS